MGMGRVIKYRQCLTLTQQTNKPFHSPETLYHIFISMNIWAHN